MYKKNVRLKKVPPIVCSDPLMVKFLAKVFQNFEHIVDKIQITDFHG